MRVLFFCEPWIDYQRPALRSPWITDQIRPLCATVERFAQAECFILAGDAQTEALDSSLQELRARGAVIYQNELRTIFPDNLTAALAWYQGTWTRPQMDQMKALVLDRLGGFVPDVVIGLFTSMPYLRELFPHALILHGDSGYFSRTPFAYTYTLDPCGMLAHGFLARFTADLASVPLNATEAAFLHRYRETFLHQHLIPKNPFDESLLTRRGRFRHTVLLPLNVSRSFALNGNTPFATQWECLCHVLDHARPDIGVVVTQHHHFEKVITPETDSYLRSVYPNYIYDESFDRYPCASQYLLGLVDAVAAVSSSLCFQALLWEKPVCALGRCQTNAIAAVEGIEGLGAFLDRPRLKDWDSLLYALLTKISIPWSDHYLFNPDWLEPRLAGWVKDWRTHGIHKDFFQPVDEDPLRLLHYFLDSLAPGVLLNAETQVA